MEHQSPEHRSAWMKPDAGQVLCSVCVATYRRPELLEKLLVSLERQDLDDDVMVEVIVVDNDAEGSGEPVVRKFRNTSSVRFYYLTQPVKNISLTRNVAVANAVGQYLLFIDDDEVASHRWVCTLLATLRAFGADGVIGPVIPEFNDLTPRWMRCRDLFYAPILPTGAAPPKYTSNCLVTATLLKGPEGPFDPCYGITGGEDTHLFDSLEQRGARFVYCREAYVSEYLPPSRTRLLYLFMRGLRAGNSHTRRTIEFSGSRHLATRLFMLSKALIFGTVSLVLMVILYPFKLYRIRWLIKVGSNIGRFMASFGWAYKGYR